MEVLYLLIRTLRIDPRYIFCPEMDKDSPAHYQLQLLINDCSEEEAATHISVCQSVISALRVNNGIPIKEKKSLPPLKSGEAGSAFTSGSFAYDHFQFYNVNAGFLPTFGTEQREFNQYSIRIYLCPGLVVADRAGNP